MAQDIISKIREAASSKGVDPDVAVRIAELESSLDPTAKAKRSSARGLFQVIDDTWKRYGGNPAKRFDVDENIRVGTNILADNTQRAKKALGRDPRPSELYAMHFFGGDVGLKVARSPEDRPIHALVTPSVLRANPQLKGKTAGQLMVGWEAKFPGAATVAVAAAQPEEREPGITRVSRSVPRPLPTAKPIPASSPLPTAKPIAASSPLTTTATPSPMQSAELPASYQAALAVSLLASDDEKEKKDEDEPSIAEQFLAQSPRTTALAGLDLSYQSPFPEPTPVRMAEGGATNPLDYTPSFGNVGLGPGFEDPGVVEMIGRFDRSGYSISPETEQQEKMELNNFLADKMSVDQITGDIDAIQSLRNLREADPGVFDTIVNTYSTVPSQVVQTGLGQIKEGLRTAQSSTDIPYEDFVSMARGMQDIRVNPGLVGKLSDLAGNIRSVTGGGSFGSKEEEFFIPGYSQGGAVPNLNEIPSVDALGRLIDKREDIRSESQRMLARLAAQQKSRKTPSGGFIPPPGFVRRQLELEERIRQASAPGSAAPMPLIDRPAMRVASDIVRGAVGGTSADPTNPSEAYKLMQGLTGAYLPTAPVVRTGQAAGAAIRQPTQSLVAAGQAFEELGGTAAEQLARLSRPNALGSQAGVIKAKGGNWPARHIQMRLDPLRTPMFRWQDPELRNAQVAEQIDEFRGSGASEQAVGQYAKSFEVPVAIDKWITNKLGKYIQNEMGTPQDPLRKLAREENITTAPPDLDRERVARYARTQRELATSLADYRYRATLPDGKTDTFTTMKDAEDWVAESNIPDRDKAYATIKAFVRDENYDEIPVVGLTPEGQPILESGKPAPFLPRQQETGHGLAKYWEDLVDSVVNPFTPGVVKAEIDLVRRGESTTPLGFRADETLAELSRISPRTPIYQLKPHALSELGFTKLTKDLEQMVSEPKLLPQALRIEPKDLDRMSVPDVVKRVEAFRNWQDEEYRREMLAKAANIPLYKEYDDGARWLRLTDLQDNKENRKYALAVGCDARWCTEQEYYIDQYTDPKRLPWPREIHVLTSRDGRPLVQIHTEVPDPSRAARTGDETYLRPAILEIRYRRNELDIPEIGYGFDRKKVKHEVLSRVQDYIRSADFRYVDEIGNAKLVDTAPYGDSDFVKRAEDVRRFGWDEQAFGPWQRFVDADSWNEAVARMQMNIRGPLLQLRNPPEGFSEGGPVKTKPPELTGINRVLDFIAQKLDPKWFATSGRILLETAQGVKTPITEKNFKPEELDIIRQLIALKGKENGVIGYDDYIMLARKMTKEGPMPVSVTPSIYSMADPLGNVQTTLGRFSYQADPKGNVQVIDRYDFNPPPQQDMREARTGDYGVFGPYAVIREYAGEKIPSGTSAGRDIRINLGPLQK